MARIIVSLLMLAGAWLFESDENIIKIIFYAAAYLVIGGDIVFNAVRNVFHGEIFDENFLMAVATIGAFATGQYPEAVAVMLFYQVGEMFQDIAVDRSRKSISSLMDIRPDYANLDDGNGGFTQVAPDAVPAGSIIVVKPGEKIPLDGVVVVSTPQDLVGMIVRKAVNMANMMNIPVLGLVENFSYLKCPDCGKEIKLFGESHIDDVAKELGIPVFGKLPLDPAFAEQADKGAFATMENAYLDAGVEKLKTL